LFFQHTCTINITISITSTSQSISQSTLHQHHIQHHINTTINITINITSTSHSTSHKHHNQHHNQHENQHHNKCHNQHQINTTTNITINMTKIHFGVCTALISKPVALESDCKCIAWRGIDRKFVFFLPVEEYCPLLLSCYFIPFTQKRFIYGVLYLYQNSLTSEQADLFPHS
jgi:hypothetical protein